MLGRLFSVWLLFVTLSGIAEAIFIVVFANNSFQISLQSYFDWFPQLQATFEFVSRALQPFIANASATVTIWTLTSMAISFEIVLVPLLTAERQRILVSI